MNYKLYTTSCKAWDAMLESIEKAEKSIYLEMYIFLEDTSESHDFIGKLRHKAEEGVKVVLIIDSFGSKTLKKETIDSIKDSGAELIIFSHWIRRIHRKILVIDNNVAFIGGVNIGRRFSQWRDLQLRLRGRIVGRILRSFAYTYEMAGGKDKKILSYRKKKSVAKLRFWLLEHWPIWNVYAMKDSYISKISDAERMIRISTPYFTPPRWLMSLFDNAIRRGVRIEVLVPKVSDLPIMQRVNYHYIQKMHSIGVHIYLSEQMNHSKLLLIDDKEGLLGSQNLDLMSFNVNAEVGLFFNNKVLIREIGQIFDEWKGEATEYSPRYHKKHAIDFVILALSKILKPIL